MKVMPRNSGRATAPATPRTVPVRRAVPIPRPWCSRRGSGPRRVAALEVRGWRSGRVISSPVVIADHDGDRYLVAMLGDEASWPRNARVAGGEVVLRHGRHETVYLVELPADRRAAVVRRYLEVAPGARAYFPIDRHAQLEERRRSRDRSPFPVVVGHLALVAGRF